MKHIGLSECSPNDVRRANAVHPIAALEMEWSLFSRDAEVCPPVVSSQARFLAQAAILLWPGVGHRFF